MQVAEKCIYSQKIFFPYRLYQALNKQAYLVKSVLDMSHIIVNETVYLIQVLAMITVKSDPKMINWVLLFLPCGISVTLGRNWQPPTLTNRPRLSQLVYYSEKTNNITDKLIVISSYVIQYKEKGSPICGWLNTN